ncbi:MAG: hypothetical protein OXN81_05890 [Alphaproteobacteria bacterium]|nr:hypothetical protein [Alphaproteobacteria bacterium]
MPEATFASDLAPWITPAILLAVFAWLRSDIRRSELRQSARIDEMGKRLDQRIDEMGKRLDQRIDEMGKRLDEMGRRMDRIEVRLDRVEERLGGVETGLAEARGQLAFVERYILGRNDAPAPEPAAE